MRRRSLMRASAIMALLVLGAGPLMADQPSGTVRIQQVQIAFWGSGNVGGGTLTFRGQTYPFTIGGLGVGGFGVSTIQATGAVFGLQRVEDFEGAYVQARYGVVVGNVSAGELWLANDKGVEMRLEARRAGLAISGGGDAVFIKLD